MLRTKLPNTRVKQRQEGWGRGEECEAVGRAERSKQQLPGRAEFNLRAKSSAFDNCLCFWVLELPLSFLGQCKDLPFFREKESSYKACPHGTLAQL